MKNKEIEQFLEASSNSITFMLECLEEIEYKKQPLSYKPLYDNLEQLKFFLRQSQTNINILIMFHELEFLSK